MHRFWIAPGLICLLAGTLRAAPPVSTTPASTSASLKPTLITLHHTNAPPADVFQDLFGQIGRTYITYPGSPQDWPAVTIDADKEPYWKVVARLDDALGVYIYPRRNGKIAVSRNSPSPENGLRCFSGPCLMLAREISHMANLTDPNHLDECTLGVLLLIEPNLQVVMYSGRVVPDLAVDEKGLSLLPMPEAPRPPGPTARNQGVEQDLKSVQADLYNTFQIVLRVPSDAGQKLAQVKGNLHLKLIEKATVIEIPVADFARKRTADFLGTHVEVSDLVDSGTGINQGYRVSLNIIRAGVSDEQWSKVNALLDAASISLLDADGFPFFTGGSGGGGGVASANRLVSASFRATEGRNVPGYQAGAPAVCRITLPEALRDVAIPFEYKNLPLP